MNRKIFSLLSAAVLVLALGSMAKADTILTLSVPNSGVTGTGPYATVDISLSGDTATVTFTSLTNGGYIYLMGDGGTADLNVNGGYTMTTPVLTNSISGFTPSYKNNTPGQVDGFGTFNLSLNSNDGFGDAATKVTFTITTTTSGAWATSDDVLTPNDGGSLAAIHAFGCATPCTTTEGAAFTGYAADGQQVPVPEPGSLALFGTGILGMAGFLRRKLLS
jgi:PEP-CTERM motif